MSQPIYLQATPGVDRGHLNAVEDALDLIDSNFENSDLDYRDTSGWTPTEEDYERVDAEPGEFSSPGWYERESMVTNPRHGGRQVDAGRLSGLLSNEPWRETYGDHVDVFVTDKDLTGRGADGEFLNYVLGGADAEENPDSIILSTYRLENSPATSDVTTTTSRSFPEEVMHTLALHEFGHLFGAPDEERGTGLDYGFEGQAHCANDDMMQPGYSTGTLAELTADRIRGDASIYCGECAEDIYEGLEDF